MLRHHLFDLLNSNNNICRSLLDSINCFHPLVGSRKISVFNRFSSKLELAWHISRPPDNINFNRLKKLEKGKNCANEK